MIIKETKKASMEDPQNQAGAEICFDILVTDVENVIQNTKRRIEIAKDTFWKLGKFFNIRKYI